nr:MAG TPA: hypothetical protein [Caudoviricetes sp.]
MANLRKIKDDANTAAISLLRHLLNQDQVEDSATNFTEKERKELAEKGLALPDGSFPIRNKEDLKDAIRAIGLGRDYDKTKAWIIKRAKALNAVNLLPEKWKVKDAIISVLDDLNTAFSALFEGWKKEGGADNYYLKQDSPNRIAYVVEFESDPHLDIVKSIFEKRDYYLVDHGKDGELDLYYFQRSEPKISDDSDSEQVISEVRANFPEWEKEESEGYFDIADTDEGIVFAEHNVENCKANEVNKIMSKFGYTGVDYWEDGDSYYFYYVKEQSF